MGISLPLRNGKYERRHVDSIRSEILSGKPLNWKSSFGVIFIAQEIKQAVLFLRNFEQVEVIPTYCIEIPYCGYPDLMLIVFEFNRRELLSWRNVSIECHCSPSFRTVPDCNITVVKPHTFAFYVNKTGQIARRTNETGR